MTRVELETAFFFVLLFLFSLSLSLSLSLDYLFFNSGCNSVKKQSSIVRTLFCEFPSGRQRQQLGNRFCCFHCKWPSSFEKVSFGTVTLTASESVILPPWLKSETLTEFMGCLTDPLDWLRFDCFYFYTFLTKKIEQTTCFN